MMILPMNESQETIAIPIAYLEALLMMFVAFLIGYIGATLYARFEAKRKAAQVALEKEELLAKISELKEDNERIPEDLLRKDRMDQELEQIQFQKRAFSEHVLTENANADKPKIDFKRIGIATATEKNDLQEIIGIGPYTEAKLNDLGIFTFEQIGKFTDDDIGTVTELIKFFPDRIKNDRWVAKANDLKFRASKDDGQDNPSKKKIITNEKAT